MQDPPLADCFWPVTAAEAQTTSFAMDDDKERKERNGEEVRKKVVLNQIMEENQLLHGQF